MSQMQSARSVADVSAGNIHATVEIAAPIERVYAAITDGAEIALWWGSPDSYRTIEWVGDVRVGGKWRSRGIGADGTPFGVEGEFLEVDPPRLLVQTWYADWDGAHPTTVCYRLEPIEGGTRLTLRHTGFEGRAASCQDHGQGWERVLGWLDGYATGAREALLAPVSR